jgi:hypothetical protein
LGVPPAKAGAATANIRVKAIIESRVFIGVSSDTIFLFRYNLLVLNLKLERGHFAGPDLLPRDARGIAAAASALRPKREIRGE